MIRCGRPAIPGMPGMAGSHENWGNFKCHKWGELLRHSQTGLKLSAAPPAPGRACCWPRAGPVYDLLRPPRSWLARTARGQRSPPVAPPQPCRV